MATMKTDNAVVEVPEVEPGRPPAWAFLTATFFGIGTLGPGPGAWGSAAAVLIWSAATETVPLSVQPFVLASMALIAIAIKMSLRLGLREHQETRPRIYRDR